MEFRRTHFSSIVLVIHTSVSMYVFFFLKTLLAVLLLKIKTRLGERSSSALLHFAAGGGHPLSREVFHSGSLSVRELPQPTLLPKPHNDSYYAKVPCYPLGVSHETDLNY